MDKLSLSALRGAPSTVVEEDEKVVRAYLRLCEDQLELRKQGVAQHRDVAPLVGGDGAATPPLAIPRCVV